MANSVNRSAEQPAPSDAYVQSFARGLQVIRSFSDKAPEQTLSEVAAQTGMTRAGARRILLTLLTLGYVETQGKTYRLTPRILDLGYAYLSSMPIWQLAQPVMDRLSEQTGESCSAAVLDGTEIVYALRVHTHKIMTLNLSVGTRLPAYCTSMGRVLLAELPDDEIARRLKGMPPQQKTRHTVTDTDLLMTRLKQVRQQGWALVSEELEEGLISIAAPVRNRQGRAVAALNVSGQLRRTSASAVKETVLPQLRAAADEVSRLLGATT